MRRCTVNSSDLEQARSLSRRLAGLGGDEPSNGDPMPQYARFPDTFPAGPPRTPSGRSDESAAPPPAVPPELESWEVLLAWGLELCQARAAFVVDSQGFVIASRGNVPDDGFEATGAELCYAMETLPRVDSEGAVLEAIELHFRGRRLVAVSAEVDEGGRFLLGFVGARPLAKPIREAILRQLDYSVPKLI